MTLLASHYNSSAPSLKISQVVFMYCPKDWPGLDQDNSEYWPIKTKGTQILQPALPQAFCPRQAVLACDPLELHPPGVFLLQL